MKVCTNSRACRQCSKRHHILLHFDNSIKHVDIKQSSTSAPTSSENITAIVLVSENRSAELQNLARPRACEFICLMNVLLLFARSWIKDLSLHLSPKSLNAYAFQELIAPFSGISEMQFITLSKLLLFRHFATDLPILRYTAFILRLTKYLPTQVNIVYHWKLVAGLELANRDPMFGFNRHYMSIKHIIGADLVFSGV